MQQTLECFLSRLNSTLRPSSTPSRRPEPNFELQLSVRWPGRTFRGDRIRDAFGDMDPLNKVPVEESQKRVQKGPLLRVSLILPRISKWLSKFRI